MANEKSLLERRIPNQQFGQLNIVRRHQLQLPPTPQPWQHLQNPMHNVRPQVGQVQHEGQV